MIDLSVLLLATSVMAAPDFDTEIVPVLTKFGCNAGACHGAAAGRGGFHLSLFGSDATGDYDALVHAFEGRRVNPVQPQKSLLLLKPTGAIKHGGGAIFDLDSPAGKRLQAWITAETPRGKKRTLKQFTLKPSKEILENDRESVSLQAFAQFDDGPEEEVTAWCVFTSPDPTAVEISEENGVRVRLLRAGQFDLIVRFLDRVEPLRLIRPLGQTPVDLSKEPRANFIDEEILNSLQRLRLKPGPGIDDATFCRRVYLDLTGTLPTVEELARFLVIKRSENREKLIDQLLKSDRFIDIMTLRFARTLRMHSLPNEKEGVQAYAAWLRNSLKQNQPMNEWAKELLMAEGDSHRNGAANFARMVPDARGHAELVSRVFLGSRIQCANCHNHPLDRWTQDDYHGLAAIFARFERGRIVKQAPRGSVTNLRTGEPAIPRLPGVRDLTESADSLDELTNWLTAKDNPLFARATVNRLWSMLFGRGLVEPVDDLRSTNPASHPQLLIRLSEQFIKEGYDLRRTVKRIVSSHAYARVAGDDVHDPFYAKNRSRPLDPEVLIDAIVQVTGVEHHFEGQPKGTRAIQLIDPLSPSRELDLLGRCSRGSNCDETPARTGLAARLHLLNGSLINEKLRSETGHLAKMLKENRTDTEVVTHFYRLALCREPSERELTDWLKRLPNENRREALEDFLWALLNSREFTTQ
jgi:hypothetical protein